MKRLTFDGSFCEIARCAEIPGGSFCEDGACSQRKTWERLRAIEDILGGGYDLDKLRTLVEADRDGRCVVLPAQYSETTGGQALEHAMRVCAVTNNAVTRYTADAIAEKVVREAEQALEEMEVKENG